MCDFRGPPSYLKVNDLIIELEYCGGGNEYFYQQKTPPKPGIYHVGASGCGYEYNDGQSWISIYHPPSNYEFLYQKPYGLLRDYKEIVWEDNKWKYKDKLN